MKIEIKRTIVF